MKTVSRAVLLILLALVLPATATASPANDNFAAAQVVSGAGGTVAGTSAGATKESGEPNHAGNVGGHSIWYRWTAPASGTATIDTVGSSFDTLLGVYSGGSVGALTTVASNDDIGGGNLASRVSFSATAGSVYQLAVDGYNGASGSVTLTWALRAPPANDNFAAAQTLSGASGSASGTSTAATKEPGEPNHAGNVGGHSIWYRWTAPASGTATIDTVGSSFDTLLGVYSGGSVGALTTLASNDDIGGGNLQSRVSFSATAGSVYQLAVDGYNGASGPVTLNWSGPSAPPPSADATLVAAGDIHAGCAGSQDAATAALVDGIAGTVAVLGDQTDDGSATQYANCYGPSWGRFRDRTRPAAGNHEYETPNASGYFGYFGAAAGDPAQGWYSYDLGAWHMVVLNSNCSHVGGCGLGSPQLAWLQNDLAAHPAACTLAYFHHPLFTSTPEPGGNDASPQPLWQALYDGGADVILNAHSRSYERFAPQTPSGAADGARGIREFIVGTGGGALDGTRSSVAPNSEVWNGTTFGVLELTLHASSYDWHFRPAGSSTFTDSGSASCH